MDATQDPDGATIASAPANARTWLATMGTASRRYPVLTCICPQQAWVGGTTTSCPSRSSSAAVAEATEGVMVSTGQVAKSATLIGGSPSQLATDGAAPAVPDSAIRAAPSGV